MTIARKPDESWPDAPEGESPYKAMWRESKQKQWDRVGVKFFGNALLPPPDTNRELIDAIRGLTTALGATSKE
jgi:hypothetical protein